MTPAGIEPATFRFVTQALNHCATAVPPAPIYAIHKIPSNETVVSECFISKTTEEISMLSRIAAAVRAVEGRRK